MNRPFYLWLLTFYYKNVIIKIGYLWGEVNILAYMYRGLEDINLDYRDLDFRLVKTKGLKELKMYIDDFMICFNRP